MDGMGRRWWQLLLFVAVQSSGSTRAAEPRMEPTEQERAQTLILLHEPIVMLQATFGSLDGGGPGEVDP